VRADHDTDRRRGNPAELRRTAAVAGVAVSVNDRVLALQRSAGNGAVVRALGLDGPRRLARDPAPPPGQTPTATGGPVPGIPGWSFSPTQPAAPDLYPWLNPDPAKAARAREELWWASQRPSAVRIDVTASGLQSATKTPVIGPPAPDPSAPAPSSTATGTPTSNATRDADAGQPQTVPVATGHPEVKGVQVSVTWGLAGEVHTKPTGPGAGKDDHATTDWQSSTQVALTVVYHDEDKPGWEWSTQFQVNWSDTNVLRVLAPIALQNVQVGSQLAYVIPLWKDAQAQIFSQVMFGLGTDGKPVAQVAGGGQIQMKVSKHVSLFLQGNVGASENSGDRNAPSYTGDASAQVGAIYQF
jgi:hypothetical protein